MTPAARLQAAIEALDAIVDGAPAEQVLTRWARGARYAGSKDRAAVRDHVFDALRHWWSGPAQGGGTDGRSRMIGTLRAQGVDPAPLFTGDGYGPAPLTEDEAGMPPPPDRLAALDCPPWLAPELEAALGDDFEPVMRTLQSRAPVHLRVALGHVSRDQAIAALAEDGIVAIPHALSPSALEVTQNPRRVAASRAFAQGWVELQDAASQAVVDAVPLTGAARILDYCAGGGGKSLAMADRHAATYHAHDAAPGRMVDLPIRAARAGVRIEPKDQASLKHESAYDVVLVDAPCCRPRSSTPQDRIWLRAAHWSTRPARSWRPKTGIRRVRRRNGSGSIWRSSVG